MKKITLIFSLLVAMFTTAMAQETVDLTTENYGGNMDANAVGRYSQWTSTNGVTIVSTDCASGAEIGTMKHNSGILQAHFTTEVTQPQSHGVQYTFNTPEGYVVTEMKIKKGSSGYKIEIDYDGTSITLPNSTSEQTITFTKGENTFCMRSNSDNPTRDFIKITSLTITKVGGDNEGDGNEGEVEGGDNNQGGEGEGEVEGGDNNEGNEGEVEGGDNNEGEGEGNDETSINEVKVENAQVIYDLTGRRVNEITKAGIYIINGKKVIK